jgi:lactate dehydrogenase-like 2-hydroxyacid dehydrogenase
VPRELIAQMPALEIVSVFGVGYDGVDVAAARERGIAVTHTPNVLNDEVADLAMALVLAVSRRLDRGRPLRPQRRLGERADAAGAQGERRADGHRRPRPHRHGDRQARRGVRHVDRLHLAQRQARAPYPYFASAEALAREVDFLVVITPGGAATRKLIDAKVLAALGKKGYLVNVARGSVVDEQALVRRLRDGTIAGAGLDVFENEPHVPSELLALDNVVLTPHVGSATWQTRQAMADLASATSTAHFAGKPLLSPVP